MVTDDELLYVDEASRLAKTPPSTLRYWAHINTGPPSFKLGRRRVWRKSVVLQWIADQEAKSNAGAA